MTSWLEKELDHMKASKLSDAPVTYREINLALHDSLLDFMHDLFAVLNRTADATVGQAIEILLKQELLPIFLIGRINRFYRDAPMHVCLCLA